MAYLFKNINSFTIVTISFLLITLPSILAMFFQISISIGLASSALFVILISLFIYPERSWIASKRYLIFLLCLSIFIFVHAIVSMSLHPFDKLRFFLSFGLSLFIAFSLPYFLQLLYKINSNKRLKSVLNSIFYLFLIMMLMGPLDFTTVQSGGKPIVIFNEISLFVVTFLPFLFYKIVFSSRRTKLLLLILIIFFALQLNTLLLLFSAGLISFVCLRKKDVLLLVVITLTFLYFDSIARSSFTSFYSSINITKPSKNVLADMEEQKNVEKLVPPLHGERVSQDFISYMISRIPTKNNNNLSAIYFKAGWERAYLNLYDTYGFGIGFQQLGHYGRYGPSLNNLISINKYPMGLLSGGSSGSKLISEFGIFGLLALIFFVFAASQQAFKIRYISLNYKKVTEYGDLKIFLTCCFISYAIQLFLRGEGYYSIGSYLFLAYFYLLFIEKSTIK